MNKKKFFSLIQGDDVQIAPNTKIIPAKEFEKLLSARQVITRVQKDALEYRQEVAVECEKIKEQAQIDGYREGFEFWASHVENLQKTINSLQDEYTKLLAPIALKAAKKIVGQAFEMSHDMIFEIVQNALRPVLQHKRITIYVNREDFRALEENREKLKQNLENVEMLSIQEREDIAQGGCVIETEGGIINARLENQWEVLEKAFKNLFKTTSKEQKVNFQNDASETLQES